MKRFTAILVLSTLAGLFYVYEEVEAVKIGYFIRQEEQAKSLALDRSRALKYNIARLKAPETLERKLEAKSIKLEAPAVWQTLVMENPSGQGAKRPGLSGSWFGNPVFFTKFFLGTAQAEAKETSR